MSAPTTTEANVTTPTTAPAPAEAGVHSSLDAL